MERKAAGISTAAKTRSKWNSQQHFDETSLNHRESTPFIFSTDESGVNRDDFRTEKEREKERGAGREGGKTATTEKRKDRSLQEDEKKKRPGLSYLA